MATILQMLEKANNKDLYTLAGVKGARFIPGNGIPALEGFVTLEIGRSDLQKLLAAGVVDADEATELDRQMVEAGIAENVAAVVSKVLSLNIPVSQMDQEPSRWGVERCPCGHATHAVVSYLGIGIKKGLPTLAVAVNELRAVVAGDLMTASEAVQLLRQMKDVDIPMDAAEESRRFEALDPEIKETIVAKQQEKLNDLVVDLFMLAILGY